MQNREFVNELIKIANIIHYDVVVPDYDFEIEKRFAKQVSKSLKDFIGSDIKTIEPILKDIWNEIEANYPNAANYAEKASNTAFGEFSEKWGYPLFDKIFEDTSKFDWLLSEPPEIRAKYEKEYEIKKYVSNSSFHHVTSKVQNFIRLMRVKENMRLIAWKVRAEYLKISKSEKGLPPIAIGVGSSWKDEYYMMFNFHGLSSSRRFQILSTDRNNKTTGKIFFAPSPVQSVVEQIDVFQIKTCANCYKIFFAEPRNMKYCSETCNNRKKSKRWHEAHRATVLQNKRGKYAEKKAKGENNGTL